MSAQLTNESPKHLLLFDEIHEGYWTGDCDCSCFNPIGPLNGLDGKGHTDFRGWSEACTYITLLGLNPAKKYRVTLHVEAEEIA